MEPLDFAILITLPILLILSGFFSGSETALFAMSQTERMHLQRRGPHNLAARAVEHLQRDPRMLLITVLLGNMVVNVAYFVISSVLLMRMAPAMGAIGSAAMALGTLLAIVLFGEVLPKLAANANRERFAAITSPALLVLHNLIAPLRVVLDVGIVAPLSRLTAPSAGPPPQLSEAELAALLEVSGRQGVIDADEQRTLREVVSMSRLRVRDVMTPRVRMAAVPLDATREEVIELARQTRRKALPVYKGDVDTIVGILPVKNFLLDSTLNSPRSALRGSLGAQRSPRKAKGGDRRAASVDPLRAIFVPHVASVDQLLEHLRRNNVRSAIAVDEYGGTAGVVSIENVVERLVGELGSAERASHMGASNGA